jgi:heme-degrading monooxygenase HmoA
MSVIIHIAGTAGTDAIPKLREAVALIQPLLEAAPGYERAELLANHPERKVQVLLQWRSFEEGMAFLKTSGMQVFLPFTGLMKDATAPMFFAVQDAA